MEGMGESTLDDTTSDTQHPIVTVTSTWPSDTEAATAARILVTEKLVACAQVMAPISCTYWWDGQVESATEFPLTAKTTPRAAPQVMARIQELHPYVVPEIMIEDVDQALPTYGAWVHDMVAPNNE